MDANDFLITRQEHYELANLARKIEASASLTSGAPVGSDLQLILECNNIILLNYPIERSGSNSFSAIFSQSKVGTQVFSFIGINTYDYYDKQIFAIAHELYHFSAQNKPHISRDGTPSTSEERKAEYFAAELLLPLDILCSTIMSEFHKSDISDIPLSAKLRFIARLHCKWWLPYKAIVKRLYEAEALTPSAFDELYAIDERNETGTYYRIGLSTNSSYFTLLNTITKQIGTSAANLEDAIRNFDDDHTSADELIKGLQLFGLKPADFGIDLEAGVPADEWAAFRAGGHSDEG